MFNFCFISMYTLFIIGLYFSIFFSLTNNSSRYIIDVGVSVIVLENCVYLNHVAKFE